jgi:wyosine [tRNA(Phe)-imidazoG37] synthetase (radical SAM superfamily)
MIYGPVPSWRLGKSLGIDLLSTQGKTCSFDCIYCQLGETVHTLAERKEFVPIRRLVLELEQVKDVDADYTTFSGLGEPTLASNLGQAIEVVKSALGLPVAVLTNSSLMPHEDVRQALARADVVAAKLDAPNEELFRRINRPVAGYSLDEILQGIRRFRSEYKGKLALQMMFVKANKDYAPEMARMATELSPDEVQINTPLRPCCVAPLLPEEIAAIRQEFAALARVVTVYEALRVDVTPLNLRETLRRRPERTSKQGGVSHGNSDNYIE